MFSINKKSLFGFKEGITEEVMVGSLSQWLICLVTTLLTLTDAVCISSFLNRAGRHSHVCIPGWQCQDSLSSNCEKSDSESMRNHSHTWTGHHRVIRPGWRSSGCDESTLKKGLTMPLSIQELCFSELQCSCGSVVEHWVCCAKGCGFDSQGTHVLIKMYNLNAIVSRFG